MRDCQISAGVGGYIRSAAEQLGWIQLGGCE